MCDTNDVVCPTPPRPSVLVSFPCSLYPKCFFSLFSIPILDCCLLDLSMGCVCVGLGASEKKGGMAMEQSSLYSAVRPLGIILSYSPAALGQPPPYPVKTIHKYMHCF